MLKRLALLTLACTAASPANADDSSCAPNSRRTVECYYHAPFTPGDPLCGNAEGEEKCDLRGLLYVPHGAKNAPALIVNHGSGKSPSVNLAGFCETIKYFTGQGFVVFAPVRRGLIGKDGDDEDELFHNTGKFRGELDEEVRTLFKAFPPEAEPYREKVEAAAIECLTDELDRAETAEIAEAILWLKRQKVENTQRLVDPDRVAILGHSGGGKVSIHAGADLTGKAKPQAVITLSSGEKGGIHAEVIDSVAKANVPMAFFQPANAKSLKPIKDLGKAAASNRKRYLAQVFPPVDVLPGVKDPDDYVHSQFLESPTEVGSWGPVALDFMAMYGVKYEP